MRLGLSRSIASIALSISLPMFGCSALSWRCFPASLRRHPEHVLGAVLVGILGIRPRVLALASEQLREEFLERVADVLEEDQAEYCVILLGRIHVVAEFIGCQPLFRLEPKVGCL